MTVEIGTLKDLERVQIREDEPRIFIEIEEDEGVAVETDGRIIELLKEKFNIDWKEYGDSK